MTTTKPTVIRPWTPGPWKVAYPPEGMPIEILANFGRRQHGVVARAYSWIGNGAGMDKRQLAELRQQRQDNARANARLIAAAPEMAESLEKALAALDSPEARHVLSFTLLRDDIKVLLASIRGEA